MYYGLTDPCSWLRSGAIATEKVGGWPDNVYGPSAIPWNEDHATPKEMSLSDIEDLKTAWVASLKRALTAGFDVIEIHNAHVRTHPHPQHTRPD